MAEHAMNDWLIKGTVRFYRNVNGKEAFQHCDNVRLNLLAYFAALVVLEIKATRICYGVFWSAPRCLG